MMFCAWRTINSCVLISRVCELSFFILLMPGMAEARLAFLVGAASFTVSVKGAGFLIQPEYRQWASLLHWTFTLSP
jgi:hypothetical protein